MSVITDIQCGVLNVGFCSAGVYPVLKTTSTISFSTLAPRILANDAYVEEAEIGEWTDESG